MLSPSNQAKRALRLAASATAASVALSIASVANGQQLTGITTAGSVCSLNNGFLWVSSSPTSCDLSESGVNQDIPDGLNVGNAEFSDAFNSTNFSGGTVQFNSSTVAFGGGSATFNNTVSFTGMSATFDTSTTFNNAADFNTAITTSGISNAGTVTTTELTTGTALISTNLTLGGGALVDMGGNVVQGVAPGVANTDAVNVAQLNAATAGVTADVTALETLTDTHTSQITNLQTTTATHTTQITSLQSNVTTVQTNVATNTVDIAGLQADLSAETAARISADIGFDNRIDALEAIAGGLDERFDDIEDRSDVGTATAVALSGAMYMPGKTFNLTGNVGTYRGAVAGAIQFGAVVSDSIAVNAGVAKGFNKRGKAAARVGFTLGW